jgi:short chain dehydrogenase
VIRCARHGSHGSCLDQHQVGGDKPASPGGSRVSEYDGVSGRVALVTGAAGAGIGRAGASVTDIHERRCNAIEAELAAAFPRSVVACYTLDVDDLTAIAAVVAGVHERFGPIRILVNNAIVNWPGPIFGYDVERWRRTLDVKLTCPWYLCRATMPPMRDAGGGAVVNVSSSAAEDGGAFGTEGRPRGRFRRFSSVGILDRKTLLKRSSSWSPTGRARSPATSCRSTGATRCGSRPVDAGDSLRTAVGGSERMNAPVLHSVTFRGVGNRSPAEVDPATSSCRSRMRQPAAVRMKRSMYWPHVCPSLPSAEYFCQA